MSEAVIKFEHVSKEYFLYKNEKARFKAIFTNNKGVKRHQALKDISFEVHKGESVGIIGRNGARKIHPSENDNRSILCNIGKYYSQRKSCRTS